MPPHRRSRRLATLVARPTYQPPRHQPISLAALALVVLASPLPPLYRRFVAAVIIAVRIFDDPPPLAPPRHAAVAAPLGPAPAAATTSSLPPSLPPLFPLPTSPP